MPRMALVVNQSMLVRHAVGRFLEARGFVVVSAYNGREALKLLAHKPPNVIVTDLDLPQMSGEELIRELKARPQTAQIPIIVLTSKGAGDPARPSASAEFVVYKDIHMERQLEEALARVS